MGLFPLSMLAADFLTNELSEFCININLIYNISKSNQPDGLVNVVQNSHHNTNIYGYIRKNKN